MCCAFVKDYVLPNNPILDATLRSSTGVEALVGTMDSECQKDADNDVVKFKDGRRARDRILLDVAIAESLLLRNQVWGDPAYAPHMRTVRELYEAMMDATVRFTVEKAWKRRLDFVGARESTDRTSAQSRMLSRIKNEIARRDGERVAQDKKGRKKSKKENNVQSNLPMATTGNKGNEENAFCGEDGTETYGEEDQVYTSVKERPGNNALDSTMEQQAVEHLLIDALEEEQHGRPFTTTSYRDYVAKAPMFKSHVDLVNEIKNHALVLQFHHPGSGGLVGGEKSHTQDAVQASICHEKSLCSQFFHTFAEAIAIEMVKEFCV